VWGCITVQGFRKPFWAYLVGAGRGSNDNEGDDEDDDDDEDAERQYQDGEGCMAGSFGLGGEGQRSSGLPLGLM
jgi:hypothetical protein